LFFCHNIFSDEGAVFLIILYRLYFITLFNLAQLVAVD